MPGANAAEVVRGLEARLTGDLRYDALLLQAIGRRGGREAARAVVEYLARSSDPLAAPSHAFLQLDLAKDPEAAAVVARALRETSSPEALRALIRVAARPGAASMVEPLAALNVEGQSSEVRMEAIRALAEVGTPEAIDQVLEAARDPGTYGDVAWKSIGHVVAATPEAQTKLLKALETADQDSRPKEARLALLRALGNLKTEAAMKPLHAALVDPDPRVREVGVRGLGRIGEPSARYVEDLVDVFSTGDPSLRRSVVLALGGIGGAEARSVLQQMQGREDLTPTVHRAIRVSLQRLGPAPKTPPSDVHLGGK